MLRKLSIISAVLFGLAKSDKCYDLCHKIASTDGKQACFSNCYNPPKHNHGYRYQTSNKCDELCGRIAEPQRCLDNCNSQQVTTHNSVYNAYPRYVTVA